MKLSINSTTFVCECCQRTVKVERADFGSVRLKGCDGFICPDCTKKEKPKGERDWTLSKLP